MSYCINESTNKLNFVKQKIISSLLMSNYDLFSICFARVYTSNAYNNPSWLYTELEGALCLVVDYSRKSARFIMFDLLTLEITFESEFYKNFNVFYTCSSDTFQCFEVSGGFIGFSIPDKSTARTFHKAVTSLTDQAISKKLKENKIVPPNEIKNNSAKILNLLKKKLNEEYFFKDSLLCNKKIEFDAYQIEKLFEMIEYDSYSMSFMVNGNSKEIEELMSKVSAVKYTEKVGFKVSDKKAYAMEIYNNMMNSNKKEKEKENESKKFSVIENIKVCVVKEVKVEKETKQSDNKKVEDKPAKKIEIKNTNTNNSKNVPAVPKGVPPVPKGVPAVPKGVPPVPKGVPPVPKGLPAIKKGLPAVKQNQIIAKPETADQNNASITTEINTINDQTNIEGHNQTEVKPAIKKREPPKPDLMSELRDRIANRGNLTSINKNENPINSTNTVINTNSSVTISQPIQSVPIISSSSAENKESSKSSMQDMIEQMSKRMGGATVTQSSSSSNSNAKTTTEAKIIPSPISSTTLPTKSDLAQRIAEIEKSYLGGTDNNTQKQQQITTSTNSIQINPTVNVVPIKALVKKPTIPPFNPTPVVKPKEQINPKPQTSVPALGKGVVPPVPKGVPPVPKAPLIQKKPVVAPKTAPKAEISLMDQIEKGVVLKKIVTVDKTGLDYLKKKKTVTVNTSEAGEHCEISSVSSNENKTENTNPQKENLFDQMRKIQLKKVIK